ncbi:hypothetical protein Smp_118010 [Schistosoma mansoni]|uniref:hypothetical protein n=1 Tax=Schistosoma mansoni TaxID=6183 RepID=UPI00022C8756|nr:hypothetical protein Smp_118010 [Schistosoma mansoni]|eukprot:XP_018645130.1 hypothetical protein Smp_118010 [Schistosoma mansoni]
MNDVTRLKTSNHHLFEQLLIDNTVKYIDLNHNQSSMSLIIDKLTTDTEQSSEHAYIYQSTYSRLPITIKEINSYQNNKMNTNSCHGDIVITDQLLNKFAKHELILNREPTYYFHIPVRSHTLPIHFSRTELKLHRRSSTLPRYNNKYEMVIHVKDSYGSLERDDNNNSMNQQKSIRHRKSTSLPRTKHALLYYPQPGSSGIVLDSSTLENRQRNIQSEFRKGEFQIRIQCRKCLSYALSFPPPSTSVKYIFLKT